MAEEQEKDLQELSTYRLHQIADEEQIEGHETMAREELIDTLRGEGRRGAAA